VVGAGRARRGETVVGRFVARRRALRATGARVTGVHAAAAAAAGVGSVAELTVGAGSRVVRMGAGARTVALVVGAAVAVVGARDADRGEAVVGRFVARRRALRATRARVAGVHAAATAAAGVGAVAEHTVVTGSRVVRMGAGARAVALVVGAAVAVVGARDPDR